MTLADAARRLAGVSDTPRLDAELLMAHALGISRERLLLSGAPAEAGAVGNGATQGSGLGKSTEDFDVLVSRRLAHEPIAYILGKQAFWTIELAVTPAVLIPRPDSETLIEAAVAHFGRAGPRRVLDLGTGSGALLLAALAEWPAATGLGIDTSADALEVAKANAAALGMADRARFELGGWDRAQGGDHDLVLCNPPYIATDEQLPPGVVDHEPHAALFAGADGLDDYRAIAPLLQLPPEGCACIEIGATQSAAVSQLFAAQSYMIEIKRDLGGRDRCVVLTCP